MHAVDSAVVNRTKQKTMQGLQNTQISRDTQKTFSGCNEQEKLRARIRREEAEQAKANQL